MSVVDTTERTLQVKIVYYGPGLSGKTTNLEQLSRQLNPEKRGDLMVLDTVGDRTLFFDWMPVELGTIRGFDVKIQLYTVPGQVRYNNTRKRVLAGVDGIVFVADSQAEALDQNEFSLLNLQENLEQSGIRLEDIPMVVQYNKRDLPSALPMEDLAEHLGLEGYPAVESVAAKGQGVLETLRLITRLTLQAVKDDLDPNRAKQKSSQVPMDGQALLAELMKGDGQQPAAKTSEPADSTDGEARIVDTSEDHIEMEAELPEETLHHDSADGRQLGRQDFGQDVVGPQRSMEPDEPAAAQTTTDGTVEELIRRVVSLEGLVTGLGLRLDELSEQADEVAALVGFKDVLEALGSDMESLSEKLNLVQRVASSLGGKTAAIERRVARLERADSDPVRAEHLLRLSRILSTVSDALAEYATVLRPKHDREGEAESEQTGGGTQS